MRDRRSGAGRRRLKAKYADFQQITRSRSVDGAIASRTVLEELVSVLLEPLFPVSKGIRLLGVTLSSLDVEQEPPALASSCGCRLRSKWADQVDELADGQSNSVRATACSCQSTGSSCE